MALVDDDANLQLTPDVLAQLMLHLDVRDVVACAQSSRKLRAAAMDDLRVWRALCRQHFSQHTQVERWLTGVGAPTSYR
jgi:hypothetical protein